MLEKPVEKKKDLSSVSEEGLIHLGNHRVAVITAEWNPEVTFAMRDAAIEFLHQYIEPDNIISRLVPGSFELVNAAARMLASENIDGIIAIGCVIQGETPHFTFISQAVANAIANLNISTGKPAIFGVLTTNTLEQALERAGGKHGNKGTEAAATLVKMLNFQI
jgi:6,7-dimethyl-8-ribityllumazine synthase